MIVFALFIISIFFWLKGNKALSLSLFFLVTTDIMWLKVFSGTVLPGHNYVFIFTNFVLLRDLYKGTLAADMKKDKLLKFLVYSYLCFLCHCLFTIILKQESLRYATAVLRVDISGLLLYFLARKLSRKEITKTFRYFCVITILHCGLYLLQYIGLNLFTDESNLAESSILRNGTPAALPLLSLVSFYVFRNHRNLILFIIPMFTGAARGMLVAIMGALAVFYRKYAFRMKYFIPLFISGVIVYYIYNNYLATDYQRYDVSFTQEIAKGFDIKTLMDFSAYAGNGTQQFSFKENGTFAFRISMVLERLIYIVKNPQFLPFGIGMVEEVSPYNTYNFFLGTANDNARMGYCMIASNDIVWSSVVLKYGLFGIMFWILFLKRIYKVMSLSEKSKWAQVGYIYLMFFIFNSFGSDAVIRPSQLLPFYLLISYCQQEKQ